MQYEPDYSKYTMDELIDASNHIDREKYRERAERLDMEIEQRNSISVVVNEHPFQQPAVPSPELHLEFHGSAREYFRIWIVNLCLTLLTLGIFSAWAKVRKKRYFYSQTILGGTPFQYLGQPIPILKGRLIAAICLFLYFLSTHFFTFLFQYLLLAGLIVVPWMVVRSIAFNTRYSAFRNITFHFDGDYVHAWKVLYVWGIIPILVVAYVIASTFNWKGINIIFGLTVVILGFSFPWWMKSLKKFIVEHTSYGGKKGIFTARGGQFFKIYFISGLIALALMIPAVILAGVLIEKMKNMSLVYLIMVPVYTGYALAYAYLQAHNGNLVWNNIKLGPLRFKSTLRGRDLIKLYVTNALGILISLGLLVPWAVIRTIKYRANHMHVFMDGELSEFQGSDVTTVTAVGAETMDFFDVDLSL